MTHSMHSLEPKKIHHFVNNPQSNHSFSQNYLNFGKKKRKKTRIPRKNMAFFLKYGINVQKIYGSWLPVGLFSACSAQHYLLWP